MSDLRLVLEIIDDETNCVADQIDFDGIEAEELLKNIGVTSPRFDDICLVIGEKELITIRAVFKAKRVSAKATSGYLRERDQGDEAPYKAHTNRELLLMLENAKPLAVFSDAHPWQSQTLIEMCEKFEPYVNEGRFVMREHLDISAQDARPPVKWILFALPAEAWRIDAYLLLWKTAMITGWNDGFERMEGSLLGYSDAQNDLFMQYKKSMLQQRSS